MPNDLAQVKLRLSKKFLLQRSAKQSLKNKVLSDVDSSTMKLVSDDISNDDAQLDLKMDFCFNIITLYDFKVIIFLEYDSS